MLEIIDDNTNAKYKLDCLDVDEFMLYLSDVDSFFDLMKCSFNQLLIDKGVKESRAIFEDVKIHLTYSLMTEQFQNLHII